MVVTGTVPDVRPWIRRAAACVVPLRSGGGTRLKILETLAMSKPVVTTRLGGEGIDLVAGQSALIADEPEAFAEAVVRVLGDGALRARLTSAGQQLVRSRYEWSAISDRLDALYERLRRR